MRDFVRELRLAVRSLFRARGWSALAVLTLALGIGATTALFSVVRAILLQALPYGRPSALVHLWETAPTQRARQVSYPDFVDLRTQTRSFTGVAGYGFAGFAWETPDGPQRLAGARVTANFFTVLEVGMQRGRGFLDAEDAVGGPQDALVVSAEFWRNALGGDPNVVGRTLVLDGTPRRIVGVLPAGFHFAPVGQADVYVTLSAPAERVDKRFMHWMWAIARLRPEVTLAAARAELTRLGEARARADARWHAGTGLDAQPLHDAIVGGVRPVALGLFLATGVVLLIAGANLAGMSMARALGRRREIAVRAALGADRRALARQFFAESACIAAAGTLVGVPLAIAGVRALVAAMPAAQLQRLPFLQHLGVHPLVLGFSVAVGLLSAVAFGVAPALRTHAGDSAETVRSGARTTARGRLRDGLVVAEIALALLVLVAAGLFLRSIHALLAVDPGFRTERLLTLRVVPPDGAYATPAARNALYAALERTVRALPGVEAAAWIDRMPLLGSGNTGMPSIVGRAPAAANDPSAELREVGASYFETLGVPLVAGRRFADSDGPESKRVVIVNRAFARALFPGEDPLGHALTFVFIPGQPALEIVGVVADEKVDSLDQPASPVLYFAAAQRPELGMSLMVRTTGDPHLLSRPVRDAIRRADPAILVASERTMDEIIAASPAAAVRAYPALLLSAFAVLALVLASIGLYGVSALAVAARVQEFGVRMALGATRASLLRLVLRRGMALAGLGVAIGLLGALAGTRALEAVLFGIKPWDRTTLAGTALLIGASALLACLVPAWRAARLSPLVAQRSGER